MIVAGKKAVRVIEAPGRIRQGSVQGNTVFVYKEGRTHIFWVGKVSFCPQDTALKAKDPQNK